MKKKELVAAIAEKAGISADAAASALNAFTEVVVSEMKKGERVQILGFGTFEVSERPARTGRNPRTNEEMEIPASRMPKFKAGKALKDAVNQ